MTGISSDHLLGRLHRQLILDCYFFNKDCCQTKLVFVCPILELKLIVLDVVNVVLVDVET